MNIVRYAPLHDLRGLQTELNRLVSTAFPRGYDDKTTARGTWNPSVDIFENADQIVFQAELPGLKREDFDLTAENNVITLTGERRFEKTDAGDNYHRVERSYGKFTRSFTLPQTLAIEEASAAYENGVLRVVLPKREAVKARKIEVKEATAKPIVDVKPESAPTADAAAAPVA